MRENKIKKINYIIILSLLLPFLWSVNEQMMIAHATTISNIKNQITQTQNEINNIQGQISGLEDEQDLISEKMDDLNSEIINMLASIGMLEEEIAQKEIDIANAQDEYDLAVLEEEAQADAMSKRIQLLYEKGEDSLVTMILGSLSFGDMLNKVMYIEQIYEYDSIMLEEYQASKQAVKELWDYLIVEKEGLEVNKKEMEEQKAYCDTLLVQLEKESANYDVAIAKARQKAAAAQALLKQEQAALKKAEEERRKQQASVNANATYATNNYTSTIDNASGSDLGKKIAKYAVQYIGNPYVAGGTSLTNGADCSGFTYRVYKDFGYNLPRTSYEQRSAGKSVNYSEAQPGDLICYSGHVGIYIGGGYIVHASSERTGIKVSKATYRSILSVQRIL